MAEDRELDHLQDEHDRAYERQQAAWQQQDNAWQKRVACRDQLGESRDRQQRAYAEQQAAWEQRRATQDATSRVYETRQAAYDDQQRAWEELNRLRDRNGPRIGSLRDEHDAIFERIKSLSSDIDDAFARGNKNDAFEMIEDVKRLRDEIRYLPPQWRELTAEINDAKNAHARASDHFRPLQDEFTRLRRIADAAKATHEAATTKFKAAQALRIDDQAKFEAAKAEHERRLEEFKNAKQENSRTQGAFKRRLNELRAEQQQRKYDNRSLAEQAGVPREYLDDVWVSIDAVGNVNIYFGGVGEPVGPGHGHYVMDATGTVTYRRDVGNAHGGHNFTATASKHSLWTPAGSQPPDGGIIAGTRGGVDQIVSFKTGGKTGDQTLIADGDFTKDAAANNRFTGTKGHRGHNHYGSKEEGGQIDEDRGKYTGPGH
jgi:archaellum component FlaC